MEDAKAQALHDEISSLVSKRGKCGGLGLGDGAYSWSVNIVDSASERNNGLPNNPLYSNFVREGSLDAAKSNHGDGRAIKRNFDDSGVNHAGEIAGVSSSSPDSFTSEETPLKKKMNKAEKKAAKLASKKQAKIAEKRAAKIAAKKASREVEEKESAGHIKELIETIEEKVVLKKYPQETETSKKKMRKQVTLMTEKKDKSRVLVLDGATGNKSFEKKRKERSETDTNRTEKKKKQAYNDAIVDDGELFKTGKKEIKEYSDIACLDVKVKQEATQSRKVKKEKKKKADSK